MNWRLFILVFLGLIHLPTISMQNGLSDPRTLATKIKGIYWLDPKHPHYEEQQKIKNAYNGEGIEEQLEGYCRDVSGKTAILQNRHQSFNHLLAQHGQTRMLKEARKKGTFVDVDEKDISGYTPLALAAWHGKPGTCAALIRWGADPNSITFFAHSSIVHEVIKNTKNALVRMNSFTNEEYRKKIYMVRMRDALALKVIQALNNRNALRVDVPDCYGKTPIDWLKSPEMEVKRSTVSDKDGRQTLKTPDQLQQDLNDRAVLLEYLERINARYASPRFARWTSQEEGGTVDQLLQEIPQEDGESSLPMEPEKMSMEQVFKKVGIS